MNATDLIKKHEGFRRFPYLCSAGKLTIGYGKNIQEVGLTEEEAGYLLEKDVVQAITHLRTEPYWLDLNEVRQAVLINMVFNLGWSRFKGFKRMLARVEAADYMGAAAEMAASRWAEQVKGRAVELADMMKTGEWSCGAIG